VKKKLIATAALFSFVFACFVAPVSAQDTPQQKAVEKASVVKLSKKTIVHPSPPTNWSKIKDLFR
jgi:hypothetical protein